MPRSTPAQAAPSHEPLVLALSDVIGEGADAHRVAHVGRWTLEAHNDDTLRMRDADIAVALGYTEPRMIRRLIKRIWPENKGPHVRSTVERTSTPRSFDSATMRLMSLRIMRGALNPSHAARSTSRTRGLWSDPSAESGRSTPSGRWAIQRPGATGSMSSAVSLRCCVACGVVRTSS